MRPLFGALVIMSLFGSIALAADATPAEAISLIEKLAGKKSKVDKKQNVAKIDLNKKKVTDADLKVISVLKGVKELCVSTPIAKSSDGKNTYAKSGITDEGLKSIGTMGELRILQLDGADITDDGLKHLAGLKNLTDLSISGCTKLTDAGMTELTKITKLARLEIYDSKITDTGIFALKRWKTELKISK